MNRLTILLVAIKLLVLVSELLAEHVEVVCRVRQGCASGFCTFAYARGSGVTVGRLADGRDAVLTCSHVVRGAERVWISWYNGQSVPCEVVADGGADGLDAALLATQLDPEPSECLPLSADQLPIGASVSIYGYPGGAGTIRRVRGTTSGASTIRAEQRIEQGMSGGAVVQSRRIVGIVWGCEAYRPCNGEYTPSCLIVPWLKRRLGTVPACPGRTVEPPPQPPPQQPPPVSPPAPPPPQAGGECKCADRIASLESRLRKAEAQLAAVSRWSSPPSPPTDTAALNQLRVEIEQIKLSLDRLRDVSFPVRTLKPDGSVFSEEVVRLGDPIELRLVPKKP